MSKVEKCFEVRKIGKENRKMREGSRKTKHCKGLIFRADVSCCPTQRGMGFFIRLNLLKKKSCPGCMYCLPLYEAIEEINNEWMPIGIECVEHGKLYNKLEYCNERRDWETGIVDDWDIELVELKEEEEQK